MIFEQLPTTLLFTVACNPTTFRLWAAHGENVAATGNTLKILIFLKKEENLNNNTKKRIFFTSIVPYAWPW